MTKQTKPEAARNIDQMAVNYLRLVHILSLSAKTPSETASLPPPHALFHVKRSRYLCGRGFRRYRLPVLPLLSTEARVNRRIGPTPLSITPQSAVVRVACVERPLPETLEHRVQSTERRTQNVPRPCRKRRLSLPSPSPINSSCSSVLLRNHSGESPAWRTRPQSSHLSRRFCLPTGTIPANGADPRSSIGRLGVWHMESDPWVLAYLLK